MSSGEHSFDDTIDRRNSSSIKWEKYADRDIIPMWVADMEFAVAPQIRQAIAERLRHPVLGYTTAPQALYDAVIGYFQQHHSWQIDPDWLVWLPGVVPGVTAACAMAGTPNDRVLVPSPVYHPLLEIPEKLGRARIDVPMCYLNSRWSIDLDELRRQAKLGQIGSLLLCSPHNPVGTVYHSDELQQIAQICAENGIVLISDEIHCDLVLDETSRHIPTAVAAGELDDHIITLMSPSKTFNLAGANCSFAIIKNPQLRKQFADACHYSVPIVPTFSYVAAQAAYQHGWPWRDKLVDYLRKNLVYLRQTVDEIPGLWMDDPAATYLAWINTADLPIQDPQAYFCEHGVGLSAGSQFGDGNFQRLNFACSHAQLTTGLQRIRQAVDALAV